MSTRKPTPPSLAKQRAAERSAAARERIKKAQRRRQLLLVGGAVLAIAVIVGVLVIVKVATNSGGAKSGEKATAAPPWLTKAVAGVPGSVFDEIGAGQTIAQPRPIDNAPPLTQNGKPEIFYMGAEFCPYCAGERWALALALERFGDLHNLQVTTSSKTDVPPSVQTLSFHGASYTSSYLALTAKEVESNQVVNGSYTTLDKLTPAQQALVQKYDAQPYVPSGGGIPFIDFSGKWLISGATYDIRVLQGKTRRQIANALSDPSSPIAQSVVGAANGITAVMCTLTGQQPGAVCTSPGVRAAAATLSSSGGGAGGASTLSPSAPS